MDRTTVVVVASAVPLVLLASVQGARGVVLHGLLLGLLGCAAAAALLLRRRAPGPGVAVTGACSMAAVALQPLPPVALLPFAVGVVIAMAADARVWAVSAVAAAYLVPLVTLFTSGSALDAARGFGTMVILVAALGGGAFARGRVARRQEEARAQADRQRRAVEDERLRIARELHDVLAHSLSSITVQAGVGLHLAGAGPPPPSRRSRRSAPRAGPRWTRSAACSACCAGTGRPRSIPAAGWPRCRSWSRRCAGAARAWTWPTGSTRPRPSPSSWPSTASCRSRSRTRDAMRPAPRSPRSPSSSSSRSSGWS